MNMKLLALTALPLSILFACGEKESDTSETTDTAEETTEDEGETEESDVEVESKAVQSKKSTPEEAIQAVKLEMKIKVSFV